MANLAEMSGYFSYSGVEACLPKDDPRCLSAIWIFKIVQPIIVAIGTVGNILNILVLSRKAFRSKPILILIPLAVSDLIFLWAHTTDVLSWNISQNNEHVRELFTKTAWLLSIFARGSSNVVISLFTIVRMVSTFFPHNASVLVSAKRVMKILAVLYSLCSLYTGFMVFGYQHFNPYGPNGSPMHKATNVTDPTRNLPDQTRNLTEQIGNFMDQTENLTDQTRTFMDQNGNFMDQTRNFRDQIRNLTDQTRKFMDQNGNFMDQTENFMDQARNFTDQTRNFMDQNGNFIDQTRNFTDQNGNLTDQTRNFMDQTRNFMDQTRKLTEQTRNLTEQTGNLSNQAGNFMDQNGNFMDQTRNFMDQNGYFADQTGNFTDQTKKFMDQTRNFTDQTRTFTDPTRNFIDQNGIFMDKTRNLTDQNGNFADQTRNFTDQTWNLTDLKGNLTNLTVDFMDQTKNVTDQTGNFTDQTRDFAECYVSSTDFGEYCSLVRIIYIALFVFTPIAVSFLGNLILVIRLKCCRKKVGSAAQDSQTSILFAITGWLFVTSVINGAGVIARETIGIGDQKTGTVILIVTAMYHIQFSNFAVNFFLYLWKGTLFKNEFKQMCQEIRAFLMVKAENCLRCLEE